MISIKRKAYSSSKNNRLPINHACYAGMDSLTCVQLPVFSVIFQKSAISSGLTKRIG
jgi:hypothetical protein